MASSMYVPQFVKLLDCVDCSADEIAISSEFATRFGHRVADSVKLKFRNGYKIRVTFDRDGMSVRPDGWRFVKHLDLVHGFGDAVVLPHSFVAKFAASLPSCFKYLLNNGAEFRGNYISQEGMLVGLSSIAQYLRLQDLNSFELLVFTFDNIRSLM
ncbi:hypothetical protein ACET3Z_031025 [Daucus carota]